MTEVTRSGLANKSNKSEISAITSLYSLTILSCSRPVKRCKRICKISCAWLSERRYKPVVCIPYSGSRPSGRYALRPPGVSVSARANISRTIDESQALPINSCLAMTGFAAALIMAMNSSIFAKATAKPSKTWPRSRALRNSKIVRRVTTSRRCCKKYSSICFKFNKRGWLSTKATMFMPKLSCSWVLLYKLFRTTSGTSPRLSSITTRIPDLSDSSRKSEMPSTFFSFTNSAIRSSKFFLFTWYGNSSTMIAWRAPLSISSKWVLARITTRPRPVR